MKNAKQTAAAVEEVMNATNLTASAALEQIKAQDAAETAAVADQGAASAPSKASATKKATSKKNAPQAKKGAKKASPKAKAAGKKDAKSTTEARAGSKSSIILGMIAKGATLGQLMAAIDWQAHSVRGFLSTAAKKQGITIESSRNKDGERFYKLAR